MVDCFAKDPCWSHEQVDQCMMITTMSRNDKVCACVARYAKKRTIKIRPLFPASFPLWQVPRKAHALVIFVFRHCACPPSHHRTTRVAAKKGCPPVVEAGVVSKSYILTFTYPQHDFWYLSSHTYVAHCILHAVENMNLHAIPSSVRGSLAVLS